MSLISLADARLRVPNLPADDDVAQDIIDEQEAWLARKIGPLTGSRTETFYVGTYRVRGKLSLARYTDEVTMTDNAVAVDTDHYRLVDNGSAIQRTTAALSGWYTGPYVAVTYEPNDLLEVQRVLYALFSLEAEPITSPYDSEQIGSYSYHRATGTPGAVQPSQQKAALVSELLPTRDPNLTIVAASRRLYASDPVINRAEREDYA
jgi:hypothetical protein